jgi:hypothetical protein
MEQVVKIIQLVKNGRSLRSLKWAAPRGGGAELSAGRAGRRQRSLDKTLHHRKLVSKWKHDGFFAVLVLGSRASE